MEKGGMFSDTSRSISRSLMSYSLRYHPSLAKAGDLIVWWVPYQKHCQSRGKTQTNCSRGSDSYQWLKSVSVFISRKCHLLLCRFRRLHNFNFSASMTTLVVGYFFLKHFSTCCCALTWVGHNGISLKFKIQEIHPCNKKVEGCTPNWYAISSSNSPTFRWQSVISTGDSFRCGPRFNSCWQSAA